MKPTRFDPPCTVEELLAIFDYDRKEGTFRWKGDSSPRHHNAGLTAGRVVSGGYVRVRVGGAVFFLHRLIWYVEHGQMPLRDIDHIDGNPANNRIENLRLSSCAQNNHNRRRAANNSSGFKGVYWHKPTGRWRAKITAYGTTRYLGLYSDVQSAADAYAVAASKFHGEFARAV